MNFIYFNLGKLIMTGFKELPTDVLLKARLFDDVLVITAPDSLQEENDFYSYYDGINDPQFGEMLLEYFTAQHIHSLMFIEIEGTYYSANVIKNDMNILTMVELYRQKNEDALIRVIGP